MELTALLGILGAVAAALWAFWVEIARLRMETVQQANRDLLAKRFAAYAKLWSKTAPTAIYSKHGFGPGDLAKLRESLSKWYFSEEGGIFLTARTREFYFALQDLLGEVAELNGWICESRPRDPKQMFKKFLEDLPSATPEMKSQIPRIERPSQLSPRLWKMLVGEVAKQLSELAESAKNGQHELTKDEQPKLARGNQPQSAENEQRAGDQIFSAIQQVASVLRSNLTVELGSRLDVRNSRWPTGRQDTARAALAGEPGSLCHVTGQETDKTTG